MDKIVELQNIVDNAKQIVFFGGAGISTESGIPDFRSQDGLYNQKWEYPPETILSSTFFQTNPEDFYRFYREKMLITNVQPNAAHYKLAELEKAGKLSAIVTQNIDGLHQKAGSKKVLELHGSIHRNRCTCCGKKYSIEYIKSKQGVPYCKCGGIIKPNVVLYGEQLDENVTDRAIESIFNADVLIIGGTSLSVYPAAGFINYFKGDKIVVINKTPVMKDVYADLIINDSIGKVLSKVNI